MMQGYDALVRTTIDLPDDVHRAAVLLSRDLGQSLSRTVSELVRTALAGGRPMSRIETHPETGLPLIHLGRPITSEDVAALQDED